MDLNPFATLLAFRKERERRWDAFFKKYSSSGNTESVRCDQIVELLGKGSKSQVRKKKETKVVSHKVASKLKKTCGSAQKKVSRQKGANSGKKQEKNSKQKCQKSGKAKQKIKKEELPIKNIKQKHFVRLVDTKKDKKGDVSLNKRNSNVNASNDQPGKILLRNRRNHKILGDIAGQCSDVLSSSYNKNLGNRNNILGDSKPETSPENSCTIKTRKSLRTRSLIDNYNLVQNPACNSNVKSRSKINPVNTISVPSVNHPKRQLRNNNLVETPQTENRRNNDNLKVSAKQSLKLNHSPVDALASTTKNKLKRQLQTSLNNLSQTSTNRINTRSSLKDSVIEQINKTETVEKPQTENRGNNDNLKISAKQSLKTHSEIIPVSTTSVPIKGKIVKENLPPQIKIHAVECASSKCRRSPRLLNKNLRLNCIAVSKKCLTECEECKKNVDSGVQLRDPNKKENSKISKKENAETISTLAKAEESTMANNLDQKDSNEDMKFNCLRFYGNSQKQEVPDLTVSENNENLNQFIKRVKLPLQDDNIKTEEVADQIKTEIMDTSVCLRRSTRLKSNGFYCTPTEVKIENSLESKNKTMPILDVKEDISNKDDLKVEHPLKKRKYSTQNKNKPQMEMVYVHTFFKSDLEKQYPNLICKNERSSGNNYTIKTRQSLRRRSLINNCNLVRNPICNNNVKSCSEINPVNTISVPSVNHPKRQLRNNNLVEKPQTENRRNSDNLKVSAKQSLKLNHSPVDALASTTKNKLKRQLQTSLNNLSQTSTNRINTRSSLRDRVIEQINKTETDKDTFSDHSDDDVIFVSDSSTNATIQNNSTSSESLITSLSVNSHQLEPLNQEILNIKNIVENELKSDLGYKIFKRYQAQLLAKQNKENNYPYWHLAVKEELYKLSKSVPLNKLHGYMNWSIDNYVNLPEMH